MGKFVADLFHGRLFKGDKGVWMIYFLLCMVSLVEVYSASSRLTFEGGHHWAPVLNQGVFLLAGFFIIMLLQFMSSKWFMLFPIPLMLLAIVLLGITALGGGGGEINGTNRWMTIMGISFQPSEVAKAALIMMAALVLAKTQAERIEIVKGKKRSVIGAVKGKRYLAFAIVGGLTLLICGIIFLDNVSTSGMLFFVIVVMMFIAHVPKDLMFKGFLGLFVFGALYITALMPLSPETRAHMPGGKRIDTVVARFQRQTNSTSDKAEGKNSKDEMKELLNDKNSQTTYAKIAIANSNFIGLGPGNSIERDFLQHAESDFIFAIIIEELGVIGASIVAFLYLILLIRVGRIALKCPTFFSAYLVLGFGIMMVLQAFVNMSVAVGLIPVTGQTLPLISKGGTSILITSFYFATILSVSRDAEKHSKKPKMALNEASNSRYSIEGTM